MTCVWLCSHWTIDSGVQSSAITDARVKRDNSSRSPNLAAIKERRPRAEPGNLTFVRRVWQTGARKSYVTGISMTCVWHASANMMCVFPLVSFPGPRGQVDHKTKYNMICVFPLVSFADPQPKISGTVPTNRRATIPNDAGQVSGFVRRRSKTFKL